MNSAGFIRIDHQKMREDVQGFTESLDASRIHPETYEYTPPTYPRDVSLGTF